MIILENVKIMHLNLLKSKVIIRINKYGNFLNVNSFKKHKIK